MLEISPHLEPIIKNLQARGYDLSIIQVEYELQKGGNQLLFIKK